MPELPEVETIVRQLDKKIKNKTISQIKIIDYAGNVHGDLTKKALARIEEVKRRAKILIFTLSNGYSFLIHLKLTGQLLYYPHSPIPQDSLNVPKATHIIFYFRDGSALFFNDFRKFGYVKLMKTAEVDSHLIKQGIGPEPLEISLSNFKKLLEKKPNAQLKPLLMDQSFIAGLGNIYAQEACYRAGILPTRKVSSLSEGEVEKIYQAIRDILHSAIKHKGTSFDTIYVTPENKRGSFDLFLKVYHQPKCRKCGSALKRMALAGRGTYFCSKCQK